MSSISIAGQHTADISLQRKVAVVLISWFAMIGVDFFLHGGLMAAFWVVDSPFLLQPAQAFGLIPVGYSAFLLIAVLVVWLMVRLSIIGWIQGFLFGLKLGALVWGALMLGLASSTTAELSLLIGWFLGQSAEMAVGGAVTGAALAGARLLRLFLIVLALNLLLAAVTILLQSVGLAPALRI